MDVPSNQNSKRKLAAILFADIQGYTALMQKDEFAASSMLRKFRNQVEKLVPEHRGETINFYGDGVLCIFDSPLRAIHCAIAMQSNYTTEPKVPVRIGIHSGTVVFEGDKIFGDSVNVASRVESLGVPGSILVSKKVRDELKNQPDLLLPSLGTFEFKYVDEPIEIFALANEGFIVPRKEEMKGKIKSTGPAQSRTSIKSWAIPATIGVLLLFSALWFIGYSKDDPVVASNKNSIAVLIFRNESTEQENEYFCSGITDDILNHLQKIASLKVMSRSSVVPYIKNPQPIPIIGQELDVNYVVEGSVRKAGDRVLINVQLIDAKEEGFIWGDRYDKELNISNIFDIQADIAKEIASSLQAQITPLEQASIEQDQTENLEAYDYYLRGTFFYNNRGFRASVAIPQALELLEKAVALDSNFALAHVQLGFCHDHMFWNGIDRSPKRAALARLHFQKGLELDPHNPRAKAGQGWYYYHVERNYKKAIAQFEELLKDHPNNRSALNALGVISGRMGDFENSSRYFDQAIEANPRYKSMLLNAGLMYQRSRKYEKAAVIYEKLINLSPDESEGYQCKSLLHLQWNGDIQKAQEVIDNSNIELSAFEVDLALSPLLYSEKFEEVLDILHAIDGNLTRRNTRKRRDLEMYFTEVYYHIGDTRRSSEYADSTISLLREQIEKYPNSSTYYSQAAVALAISGQNEDALTFARKGVDMMPVSLDAYRGHEQELALAKVFAIIGDHEKAINKLRYLLSIPGFLSGHMLRLDPIWKSLRSYDEFQALALEGGLRS